MYADFAPDSNDFYEVSYENGEWIIVQYSGSKEYWVCHKLINKREHRAYISCYSYFYGFSRESDGSVKCLMDGNMLKFGEQKNKVVVMNHSNDQADMMFDCFAQTTAFDIEQLPESLVYCVRQYLQTPIIELRK